MTKLFFLFLSLARVIFVASVLIALKKIAWLLMPNKNLRKYSKGASSLQININKQWINHLPIECLVRIILILKEHKYNPHNYMIKFLKIHHQQANNFLNFPCYEFFLTFHALELSYIYIYIYTSPKLRITIFYIILMTFVLQILTK